VCGEPIVWNVRSTHPKSASVDHIVALKHIDLATAAGRALAVDPSLLRICHRGCNTALENRSRAQRARRQVQIEPTRPAAVRRASWW
jgi:hypothetical protein